MWIIFEIGFLGVPAGGRLDEEADRGRLLVGLSTSHGQRCRGKELERRKGQKGGKTVDAGRGNDKGMV